MDMEDDLKPIRVEYLFINETYRLNDNRFDAKYINEYTKHLQKKYSEFSDKINSQNGYIQINLSDSRFLNDGIHYDCFIMGITKELNDEIEKTIPSD
jgi:hypothetical protein